MAEAAAVVVSPDAGFSRLTFHDRRRKDFFFSEEEEDRRRFQIDRKRFPR